MGRYYHIDRDCRWMKPGCINELIAMQPHWSHESDSINRMFPYGLSRFGVACLSGHPQNPPSVIKRELLFEQIRTKSFPSRPSRLASLFACRSLEDARSLLKDMGNPPAQIWELNCDDHFIADMKWANYIPR